MWGMSRVLPLIMALSLSGVTLSGVRHQFRG
jgi:hypothetical protein